MEIAKVISTISGDWVEFWDNRLDEFICLVDRSGKTRYVSFGIQNVLGYNPEEIIGTQAFRLMDEGTQQTVFHHYEEFLETKRSVEFQYRSWTKKGEPVTLHCKTFVVISEGRSIGVISIIQRAERAKQYPQLFEAISTLLEQMIEGKPL
ncbi:PAS domain-containing protein [Ammoniphilus sp. CFH 90114]|uniref:PAS domain-containing protein n=1 Tax=Ammoniphilus sp. CFH 90114 TaxID=2493665 RepID=UPI0013E8FA6B|nr:PAS domain-containing protein [Ammoniphilus sp. CFH 90114]